MQPSMARPNPRVSTSRASLGQLAELLRDIARGGLAGLLTGILVVGILGRVVMRLSAVLVPEAAGLVTENGNRIGDITLDGTVALIVFGGLFFGLSGAVVWVVVSPWLPGTGAKRALFAGPAALGLTGIALIDGFNPDFDSLQFHPGVVAMLLALVVLAGVTISLIDTWLEARLPVAGRAAVNDALYLAIVVAGAALVLPLVLQAYLFGHDRPLGLALVVVGVVTLVLWAHRLRGQSAPRWLSTVGRSALLVAVAIGFAALAPDVGRALHWR